MLPALFFRSCNSSNPDISKYPLMLNRIHDPFDSEYRAYFRMCHISLKLKKIPSETVALQNMYSNLYFLRL